MGKNKRTATLKVVTRVEEANDNLLRSDHELTIEVEEMPKDAAVATLLSSLECMAKGVGKCLAEKAGIHLTLEEMFATIIMHKNIMDMRKRGQAVYEKNVCN